MVVFALARLGLTAAGLLLLVVLGFPYGRATAASTPATAAP